MRIGTTTVENLLRVARRDTAAGTAFAALDPAGRASEIISVPEPGSAEGLSADELAELVRQASADPEFFHARVFVRTGRVGRQVTLAIAPLHGGDGHGMIGLVAEPDRRFEAGHLEVLGQLAERLVRHLRVVQQLSRGGDPGASRADPGANGGGERPDRLRSAGPWAPEAPHQASASPQRASEAPRSVPASPQWASEAPEFPLSVGAGAPGDAPTPAQTPDRVRVATSLVGPASQAEWWAARDQLTGLPGPASFFSRSGRLLAPGARSVGTFVLVVVEVPDIRTAQAAARALAAALRSTDPVARVDERLFAAALLLTDEGGDVVEQRLAVAVGTAVGRPAGVRTAHVAAMPGDDRDVDELLRDALALLHDR